MVNVDCATEDGMGDDEHESSSNNVHGRICQPENADQAHMIANPTMAKLDQSEDGFAAAFAAWLSCLQLGSTVIAKHWSSPD
jgi:hypothetical protein